MNSSVHLFSEFRLAGRTLRNRIVMAPMTRNRAGPGNAPTPLNAVYYRQRASAGLIVAESTQISATGVSYPRTPGIHSPLQIKGWAAVADAVHDAGGVIVLQICHGGRISHPLTQPDGELPVAPSAIAASGTVETSAGELPMPMPRALSCGEIASIVAQFAQAAANARSAGFDGIELHGANGYLIDQFIRDGANQRADAYGGSASRRVRFLAEVVEAVGDHWDAGQIGLRISPRSRFNDMRDSDPAETFAEVADRMHAVKLGYLHVIEPINPDHYMAAAAGDTPLSPMLRRKFGGALILNGGYQAESAERTIESGAADLIAFGEAFISNPDLPTRFLRGLQLSPVGRENFYQGDDVGYTTYPPVDQANSS